MQMRSGQDMLMEIVRLPPEIDLRNGFVGAKQPISRYSRYGSFQGEWTTIPLDKQFAWEVSESGRVESMISIWVCVFCVCSEADPNVV